MKNDGIIKKGSKITHGGGEQKLQLRGGHGDPVYFYFPFSNKYQS